MHLMRTIALVLALLGLVASPAAAWRAPVRQNHRAPQLRLPTPNRIHNSRGHDRGQRLRRSRRVRATLKGFVHRAMRTNPTMWAKAGSLTGRDLSPAVLKRRVQTYKRLVVLQRVALNDKMLINAAAAKLGF